MTDDLRLLLRLRLPDQRERPAAPARLLPPKPSFNAEYQTQRRAKKLLPFKEAARYLDVGRKMITYADKARLLPPTVPGVRGRVFRQSDLEPLKERLSDRITVSSVRNKYGLSTQAYLQMVAAGHFDGLDDTPAVLYPSAPFVRRTNVYEFIAGLHRRCGAVVPANDLIPVREIFMALGARDKPWMPFFEGVISGEISVYPPLDPTIHLEHLRIRRKVTAEVRAMHFDFGDFPNYERPRIMSGPEWAEYLNIGKLAKCEIVENRFLPVETHSRQHYCSLAAVQRFAAKYISLWEIRALMGGEGMPSQQLRGTLAQHKISPALGAWFWLRSEIEAALNERRLPDLPAVSRPKQVNFQKLFPRPH